MLGRFGLLFLPYFCLSEVIQIGKKNKKILKENEVVIVNFYIKECKFSESFNPIIQETAVLLAKCKFFIKMGPVFNRLGRIHIMKFFFIKIKI